MRSSLATSRICSIVETVKEAISLLCLLLVVGGRRNVVEIQIGISFGHILETGAAKVCHSTHVNALFEI